MLLESDQDAQQNLFRFGKLRSDLRTTKSGIQFVEVILVVWVKPKTEAELELLVNKLASDVTHKYCGQKKTLRRQTL